MWGYRCGGEARGDLCTLGSQEGGGDFARVRLEYNRLPKDELDRCVWLRDNNGGGGQMSKDEGNVVDGSLEIGETDFKGDLNEAVEKTDFSGEGGGTNDGGGGISNCDVDDWCLGGAKVNVLGRTGVRETDTGGGISPKRDSEVFFA